MAHMEEALESLWEGGVPAHTAGIRFERLVRDVLLRHPREWGHERFTNVWSWQDWPGREEHGYDKQDLGIDLVAEQTDLFGGGLCAIQCKVGRSEVETREVDSFIHASATPHFASRLLVTQRPVAANALKKLGKARPVCSVLSTDDMDSWVEDWREVVPWYCREEAPAGGQPPDWEIVLRRHIERDYQSEALDAIKCGYADGHDRGRLILPCGTGKSFVALRAAEQNAGRGSTVLYLVPSIALLGQTMTEWSVNRDLPLVYVGVCSDVTAGRRDKTDSGSVGDLTELAMPVTTDAGQIADVLAVPPADGAMRVVFSTYQSCPTLVEAMKDPRLASFEFGLIICDEAHRTTGLSKVWNPDTEQHRQSPFTICHDDDLIPARRRLYQTATPRVFSEQAAAKVRELQETQGENLDSYSMDDETKYGPEFYRMSFAKAVEDGHLSDYQVVVALVDKDTYQNATKKVLEVARKEGLPKQHLGGDWVCQLAAMWDALATPESATVDQAREGAPGRVLGGEHGLPVRSAIAFSNTKARSRRLTDYWKRTTDEVLRLRPMDDLDEGSYGTLQLDITHIDANTSAIVRKQMLRQLREHANQPRELLEGEQVTCRVLSNAKVLTEGVDVPALDAVIFAEPRASEVDVTQAVGRVMRKSQGKEIGYVIVPVMVEVATGEDDDTVQERAKQMLDSGDFSALAKVLRALRSHDERVDCWINHPEKVPNKVVIHPVKSEDCGEAFGDGAGIPDNEQMTFWGQFVEMFGSLVVARVGDRRWYAKWGQQASRIAGRVARQLDEKMPCSEGCLPAPSERPEGYKCPHGSQGACDTDDNAAEKVRKAAKRFLRQLQVAVSPSITYEQAKEMLSHHVVTMPVFEHLFPKSSFAEKNPVSKMLQTMVAALPSQDKADSNPFAVTVAPLSDVYRRMQAEFDGADSIAEKMDSLQRIYEGFFKAAMPERVKQLGIAYTPTWIVDAMWRAINGVCGTVTGTDGNPLSLSAPGVQIIDPFVGMGTFVHRLMGVEATPGVGDYLIANADFTRKYQEELHANEMVLLAYYMAALNIEAYARQRQAEIVQAGDPLMMPYLPFDGIVLTDTFLAGDLYDRQQKLDEALEPNSERLERQNRIEMTVVASNPPWSAGKKSADDVGGGKQPYEELQGYITDTYVKRHTEVTGKPPGGNGMGNLYVKAFRWATERLLNPQKEGNPSDSDPKILAFIHPNSLACGPAFAGMRASLSDEFTDIWVVNLRGDANKSGEERRREGDNVFEGGTRNGVQITICLRDPAKIPEERKNKKPATVRYAGCPEYASVHQKRDWLESLGGWTTSDEFEVLPVTPRHDWQNIPDEGFGRMLPVVAEDEQVAASHHAAGVKTNCDLFVYASSQQQLQAKVEDLLDAFSEALDGLDSGRTLEQVTGPDERIKWHAGLISTLKREHKKPLNQRKPLTYDPARARRCLYRPFLHLWLYEDFDILQAGQAAAKMFPRDTTLQAVGVTAGSTNGSPDAMLATGLPADLNYVGPGRGGVGSSPAGGDAVRPVEHEARSTSDADAAGLGGDSRVGADESGAPAELETPPDSLQPDIPTPVRHTQRSTHPRPLRHRTTDQSRHPAMLIAPPSTRTKFAALATLTLPDLHTLDPACRAVPLAALTRD